MKITDITVKAFRTTIPGWDMGHARLVPEQKMRQTVTTIHTDECVVGHYLGGAFHGIDNDGLNVVDAGVMTGRIKNLLVGQDPLDQRLHVADPHAHDAVAPGGEKREVASVRGNR